MTTSDKCPKCNAPPIATVAKAEWECGSYIPKGMKAIQRSDTCCCSEAIAKCEELDSQLQAERAAHEQTAIQLKAALGDWTKAELTWRAIYDGEKAACEAAVKKWNEAEAICASLQQQLREATSKLGAWELDAKIQGWRAESSQQRGDAKGE